MTVSLPGGGRFGRSAEIDVRNPVLRLTSAKAIMALPVEQRRPLGILLRELSLQADEQAEAAWRKRKGIMAAYWRAVATYAKHLARAIDPANLRATDATRLASDIREIVAEMEGRG